MKLNLILSIALHAFVGGAVVFFASPDLRKSTEVIQFEIQDAPKSKLEFAGSGNGGHRGKSIAIKPKGSNLNLFGKGYVADSKVKVQNEIAGPSTDYRDHAMYIGDAESFISDGNQWTYFEQVFKKVDEQLIFDSLLAQYNHFGNVYVEFEVDAQGRFVERGLKVTAEDAILKVHALRALIKGLSESFDKAKWNPTGKSQIFQANFKFVQNSYSENRRKQSAFAKPVLAFNRSTPEKPIPTNLTDQLLTGGVHYDLFSVTERWQKYNKRKKLREQEFDPFAAYKADPLYKL
ncbi:hypothetical protein B9G69_008610 [Bdellovibrio sp. SKB1291214]|uniref:hypothetical protein n=1 Tax=Bdellovibrio sp. SKB1291214 TaxID=1732569 RepID=UPI000B51C323|nr:hypothetical protein [Bdellovibrio sp. SKB1291214]UYL10635.1 hypothetical protein B9G69_008610 [Bdellovibrio sp. SKB1291214]